MRLLLIRSVHTTTPMLILIVLLLGACESGAPEGIGPAPTQDTTSFRAELDSTRALLTARTLKVFEELLAPHRFERVHMSHLVNLLRVRKFLHRDGGVLVLDEGTEVPVSQRRSQQVIAAIGRL